MASGERYPASASGGASELGLPFYEAAIETNAHNISLLFSGLAVDTVQAGHVLQLSLVAL
jgi:hypothetical protein